MILSDVNILQNLKNGQIEIEPFDPKCLGPNSYDLHLGETLLVYTEDILDCKRDNPFRRFNIPEEGFTLIPGELYLGSTIERTRMRQHAPTIEGKSSIGRLGISIHITAGFGDIGFNGHWTLEITAQKPVTIYSKMPIAQISFVLPLTAPSQSYALRENSKYHKQPAQPMPSRMFENFVQDESLKQ